MSAVRQRKSEAQESLGDSVKMTASLAKAEDAAHQGYDFGGPIGALGMMTGFPVLMWYLYISSTYYDGLFAWPAAGQTWSEFGLQLWHYWLQGCFPTWQAWAMLWIFLGIQAVFYVTLPGVWGYGLPLAHLGNKALPYYCNAVYSFYTTIVLAFVLHVTGLFPMYTLIDRFGEVMSVAIFSGIGISFGLYFWTLYMGHEHRMSGNFIYDVFMGANLNPRTGIIDWKMFFEVRLPWFILFFTSLSAAVKQYEVYGYVTPQVMFVLYAHWLYANACSKGEELIITTWDMFFEKFGFMLIFWNMAGVPFTYAHCTLFLINHKPEDYEWSTTYNVFLFVLITVSYYFFDVANSQKNRFRQQRLGTMIKRNTFPQLPWQTIKNPTFIKCKNGSTLLTSGVYGWCRKPNYTADFTMCLTWALMCGIASPLPYFYPVFFFLVLIHRAYRDFERLERKYGEDYEEFKRQVPWIFIPYVF
ncbi:Delta(24(24(1)))-sterol reductase [Yarrowia sp. C11]|nr:Delta(24(24(1)))-sterol reductase [Yarrowia sp. E02]KAG5367631.1 Delta(24(24(1)))-sterol reductase [Yarrowia sp. C11]